MALDSAQLHEALRERLRELAQRHRVPGAAVGVDLGGREFFASHGVTHVEHPLPVDPDTLFQIASNSKPFTAALVMQLVGEGALELDDPVRKHLPALSLRESQHADAIRVRQLLCHHTGWDGDAVFVRPPEPPELGELFGPLAAARQLVPPGTHWTYCNSGFSLAGLLVQSKRGRPFAAVLRERLLEPLGMQRSFTRADEAIVHRVALPHRVQPGAEPEPLRGGGWQRGWEIRPVDTPAAGMLSSTRELLRWLRFWLGRGEPGALPPLSDALRAQACEDQLPPWNPQAGHAIGWAVRLDPSARVLSHGGLSNGYCSFTLFAPELDLAMVVLTNATSGNLLHTELTRWLVGEVGGRPWRQPEPLASPPALAPYTGAYWSAWGVLRVQARDTDLEIETLRHPTDDGSYQPPPVPPMRARLCSPLLALVTDPEPVRGALIDFDPDAQPPGWLRFAGRIAVRD